MADIELDKINRLAAYLDWVLVEMRRETGSKLADTRTGELLGNAAAAAHELSLLLGLSPRTLDTTDLTTDESSTRH